LWLSLELNAKLGLEEELADDMGKRCCALVGKRCCALAEPTEALKGISRNLRSANLP